MKSATELLAEMTEIMLRGGELTNQPLTTQKPVTSEDIQKMKDALFVSGINWDLLKEKMKEEGFYTCDGAIAVLPEGKGLTEDNTPDFVYVSPFTDKVLFMKRPEPEPPKIDFGHYYADYKVRGI